MNDVDAQLNIEINYKKQNFFLYTKYHLKLEEIIKKSIKKFNIDENNEKNIYLYYIDDDGDMIKIETIEDIYLSSKEVANSENIFSKLYLDISQDNKYAEKNEQKYLAIIKEKELKTKKLEEEIENLKREYSEKINKLKFENMKLKEIKKSENNYKKKDIIQKKINELFNNEKNNFLEEIKSIKNSISFEMKEKQSNNKNEKFNKIKSYINGINKNLNDNTNKINNINDTIIHIKKLINEIEIKNQNNNQDMITKLNVWYNFMNGLPQLMNMNKPYYYFNCKNIYFLNENIDAKENK